MRPPCWSLGRNEIVTSSTPRVYRPFLSAAAARAHEPESSANEFIAGITDTMLGHAARPVFIKSNGQLGVRPALSSGAKPLSAAVGKRLLATVKRQQRQIDRLREEVRRGG